MADKARREQGTGSVYHDQARNRWVGAITVDGRRRKVTGKTEAEVKRKLRPLAAQKELGTGTANRRVTVADTLTTFLERDVPNRRRHGQPLSPRTIEVYRWAVDTIDAQIGKKRLADLTVADVEKMLDRLGSGDDALGSASLTKIRGTLQRAIAFAIRRGEALRNVAVDATLPPTATPARKRNSMTPDDARKLLTHLRTERDGAMFGLMLRVGLRPGEAAGIHWGDLTNNVVNITHAIRMVGGRSEVVDELKVETSRRTIELPDDLLDWIAEHRRRQAAERLAAASWDDDRLVFPDRHGRPQNLNVMRYRLDEICKRADVPRVAPNELRHSCASLLSDLGVPHESIADLLGHTTTRMVDMHYRHRLRPVVDVAARADWTAQSS